MTTSGLLDLEETDGGSDDRRAIAAGLEQLCQWAAALRFDDIPEAVRASAALVLFDDIAAMVAARREPELVRLQDGLLTSSGAAESTIFRGGATQADRYTAAVANASAGDWAELDEGYRVTSCHAGVYILPALLAEAEAEQLTFPNVLRCLIAAYEVTTRFARAFPGAVTHLHPHAAFSAIGAGVATALARGASPQALQAAAATAVTMVAPGPRNHAGGGALVRNVWPAIGAWNGMRAAEWSAMGVTGLAGSPYDVFTTGLGSDCAPSEMTHDLGGVYAITQNFQKLHACCQHLHCAVEAMLDLTQTNGGAFAPENIANLSVAIHHRAVDLDGVRPATTLAAKFSLPHAAAATAVLGHAGADAFAAGTLDDPGIDALRHKVDIQTFEPSLDPPNDRPARIRLTTVDGVMLEAECLSARGGPDRPFAQSEILTKIDGICQSVYPSFGAIARRAVALEPSVVDQSWDQVVAEITKS
jgi:2-methylcitrate dehydratase PrpD